MSAQKLDRNIFQRLFGICATRRPARKDGWVLAEGKITVDLNAMPELVNKGSAVRLDGKGLGVSVLVVHGDDGEFHAFENRCTHGKRALDPVPGTETVQCCSVGTSTFNYDGSLIEGPAKGPLTVYKVDRAGETLSVTV
ncbi:MAG: Rieske (2Fe-2S) protein [Chlorobiales bacterium]|nr:Rieske (2Fe-2S) protein [Chlorobiales bacterium]